jgi:hypothetical protein
MSGLKIYRMRINYNFIEGVFSGQPLFSIMLTA